MSKALTKDQFENRLNLIIDNYDTINNNTKYTLFNSYLNNIIKNKETLLQYFKDSNKIINRKSYNSNNVNDKILYKLLYNNLIHFSDNKFIEYINNPISKAGLVDYDFYYCRDNNSIIKAAIKTNWTDTFDLTYSHERSNPIVQNLKGNIESIKEIGKKLELNGKDIDNNIDLFTILILQLPNNNSNDIIKLDIIYGSYIASKSRGIVSGGCYLVKSTSEINNLNDDIIEPNLLGIRTLTITDRNNTSVKDYNEKVKAKLIEYDIKDYKKNIYSTPYKNYSNIDYLDGECTIYRYSSTSPNYLQIIPAKISKGIIKLYRKDDHNKTYLYSGNIEKYSVTNPQDRSVNQYYIININTKENINPNSEGFNDEDLVTFSRILLERQNKKLHGILIGRNINNAITGYKIVFIKNTSTESTFDEKNYKKIIYEELDESIKIQLGTTLEAPTIIQM